MILGIGNRVRRGFTFLELIIVCAIIAILTAVGMPLLRQTASDMARRSYGKRIVALCRFLSSSAASEHSVITLSIDTEVGKVKAMGNAGNKTISSFTVPDFLRIECNTQQIIFNPDGTCANFTITISGKGRTTSIMPAGYGRFTFSET
jgi:prepilin-type N-terminal cleavage/methylation domain-containing protein